MRRATTAAVACAVLLAGCTGDGTDTTADREIAEPETQPSPSAPPTHDPAASAAPAPADDRSLIATAVAARVTAREEPSEDAAEVASLVSPTDRGAPRVFLVEQQRGDWLEVLLPVRPNGTTGWIRADDVSLTATRYAVEVDLAAFELRLSEGDEIVLTTEIGYGTQDTPTPGGRYFVTELLQPPDPDSVYGAYAFGLSGFSDVLLSFSGGEGVIGIHGTNDPGSLGTRVSAGCIRVANDVITELAGLLPLGTPVEIVG